MPSRSARQTGLRRVPIAPYARLFLFSGVSADIVAWSHIHPPGSENSVRKKTGLFAAAVMAAATLTFPLVTASPAAAAGEYNVYECSSIDPTEGSSALPDLVKVVAKPFLDQVNALGVAAVSLRAINCSRTYVGEVSIHVPAVDYNVAIEMRVPNGAAWFCVANKEAPISSHNYDGYICVDRALV
jgi:hypothetical protein